MGPCFLNFSGESCFNSIFNLSSVCIEHALLADVNSKVLSLLEGCFDLISGSSLHKKFQIMGGKITENLGFKSPLRKVKIQSLSKAVDSFSNPGVLLVSPFLSSFLNPQIPLKSGHKKTFPLFLLTFLSISSCSYFGRKILKNKGRSAFQ